MKKYLSALALLFVTSVAVAANDVRCPINAGTCRFVMSQENPQVNVLLTNIQKGKQYICSMRRYGYVGIVSFEAIPRDSGLKVTPQKGELNLSPDTEIKLNARAAKKDELMISFKAAEMNPAHIFCESK